MKKIKYFILDKFKDSSKPELYENEYELLLNLFNNEIPEEYINQIKEGNFNDFILENLNTHDVKKLQNKIKKDFSNKYVFEFEETLNFNNVGKEKYDKKSFYIIASEEIINKMSKDKDLENLIKFYGYYISNAKNDYILVCPKYSEYANNLVYNKNHGILYHFTTLNNEERILKRGLLPMEGIYYRKFPKRIYCYSEYKDLKNIKGIKDFIDNVVGKLKIQRYGLLILKIDLSKHNVCFYTDDYMDEEESVFTYTPIPPECIKKINIKYDDLN